MLLGDLGSDVVKIEPPRGDPLQQVPAYEVWNRNKRITNLDLRSDQARSAARRLVAGADVVIDGLKPGALRTFGLGPETLTQAGNRVIYCALPGFGGALGMGGIPAWEPIIAAAAGLFRPSLLTVGEAPETAFTALPIASVYAGVVAATSIIAALYARGRIGGTQRIEVPLYDALMLAIGYGAIRVNGERVSAP